MLRLKQERTDDCFITAVSCITEVPREELPEIIPTNLPNDIEGRWSEWAEEKGYSMSLTKTDPGGLCIANLLIEGEWAEYAKALYNADYIVHSVVWDKGVVWDPWPASMPYLGDATDFVKIERTYGISSGRR